MKFKVVVLGVLATLSSALANHDLHGNIKFYGGFTKVKQQTATTIASVRFSLAHEQLLLDHSLTWMGAQAAIVNDQQHDLFLESAQLYLRSPLKGRATIGRGYTLAQAVYQLNQEVPLQHPLSSIVGLQNHYNFAWRYQSNIRNNYSIQATITPPSSSELYPQYSKTQHGFFNLRYLYNLANQDTAPGQHHYLLFNFGGLRQNSNFSKSDDSFKVRLIHFGVKYNYLNLDAEVNLYRGYFKATNKSKVKGLLSKISYQFTPQLKLALSSSITNYQEAQKLPKKLLAVTTIKTPQLIAQVHQLKLSYIINSNISSSIILQHKRNIDQDLLIPNFKQQQVTLLSKLEF